MLIDITVITHWYRTRSVQVGLLARPPPRRTNDPLRTQPLGLVCHLSSPPRQRSCN